MATHPPPRQQQLSRLFIPPSLNSQQPMAFNDGASLFSPSLPTSIQQGMLPPFPMHHGNPLQTPMQPSFFPQPPGAPGRPTMHRAHPSLALAAAGIFPPPGMLPPHGMPMTPLAQNGFPAPLIPGVQPFIPRSKRAPSVSTGGPPKAVLGGPQRKVSPLPPAPIQAPTAPIAAGAPGPKKKIVLNLPRETVKEDNSDITTRPSWARTPVPFQPESKLPQVKPPELTTADPYPPDSWRYHIPPTVDVFLPGKGAWDTMKQRIIEEKLERLGVERGAGSTVPHIHAPHARAASISSPADPALLFFKLNKLQQSQNASASNSLSTSPQPPLLLSPSPGNGVPPRFQGRHGHSMSLVQPPSFQTSSSPLYNPTAAFNPFGPTATLGSDQIFQRGSPSPRIETIHAPQGRVPTSVSSLAPPAPVSRPESRPDFLRGFGLDVTEEEEEPEEEAPADVSRDDDVTESMAEDASREDNDEEEEDMGQDDASTVAQSRIHSRHVSKLSIALSLRSVGGLDNAVILGVPREDLEPEAIPLGEVGVDDTDRDAVGEWTGSEDLRTGAETSEDESIGEWSNPSDEERARQDRLQRRMIRRAKQIRQDLDNPRRLPNFPRPPETALEYASGDDDVVSNPSDEERARGESYFDLDHREHYSRPASHLSGQGRPLPPLPHSRAGSAQYTHHDPALAHSRNTSDNYVSSGLHSLSGAMPTPTFNAPAPRKDSLNPLAKPFMFGAATFGQASFASVANSVHSHSRTQSFGKPLNVAAPEFKPGGFTFQPPPGVPQLNFAPSAPRPLPTPPMLPELTRASQGREKRQRRGSSAEFDAESVIESEGGKDNITSFKFPPSADAAKPIRHSAPASPPGSAGLDFGTAGGLSAAAKPFTFSGFTSSIQFGSSEDVGVSQYPVSDNAVGKDEFSMADSTIKAEVAEPEAAQELPFPPTAKPKRAPIPLDFKHPVSTTTVPAAVFKNLNNGDSEERTRRTVRSRLSSRDIFEHSPRPSLDDLNVPTISQRMARGRLFTDPGFRDASLDRDDVFSSSRRRSSLPPRHMSHDSIGSDMSIGPMNLSRRVEMQQYERRLEELLDEKIEGIKQALHDYKQSSGGQGLNASTEAMISEVVSLFRTQLQESAARSLEDTQMDARGELDFEVLKGIIEQGHMETRALMQHDLANILAGRESSGDIKAFAKELSDRTLNTVMSTTSQISMHLRAMEQSRPSLSAEREAIVMDVMSALTPHLNALRVEPIDYESLTMRLTQAVKPHISQLIDLASDKRETAGLIVDRLVPILPSLQPAAPEFDVESIVGRLTTEVRKIVGPLDAHEIKEQVSDLVVERLDSRLAVRDRAFNVEVVTEKVTESVSGLLAPLQDLKNAVDTLGQIQQTQAPELDLTSLRQGVLALLSDLPDRLVAATDALSDARSEFNTQREQLGKEDPAAKNMLQIEATLSTVADDQKKLVSQNIEFSDFCQNIIKHINALPEAMVEATKVLQDAQADFISRDTSAKDSEEIRRLMTASAELQVQLAKARGAHGQVRVEKDMLSDRLRATEADRDRLHSRLDELQATATEKIAEASAMEARNHELEEALSQALERIKSSDVTTQTNQERVMALERSAQELSGEKHQLKSKVDSLELSAMYSAREKELLSEEVVSLRKQNDDLSAQQSQLDELRRTNENIQALASLVAQADNEELKELRRTRDRFKVLEGEHASLQRRLKDHENRATNSERTALTARQSLTQAQQRAMEWEKRAKDYEHELESTRNKLDQAEQSQSQLDADYSLVKLQLEERDAEERLTKDRESKLRDQIAAQEEQLARVQAEADQANKAAATAVASPHTPAPRTQPSVPHFRPNGNGFARSAVATPPRPDSRASTIYGDSRVTTPTAPANGTHPAPSIRGETPPQPSVWNSIHAPTGRRDDPIRIPMTPKAKRPQSYYRPQIPSPTPSNVSAAPTLGNDGWWA